MSDWEFIIAGEDSLPDEFINNEITIYPWDSEAVVVLILNDKEESND